MNTSNKKSTKGGQHASQTKAPQSFAWSGQSLSHCRRLETISKLLNDDEEMLRFILDLRSPQLRLPVEALIKQTHGMSQGKTLLFHAAIGIWSGQGDFNIFEALKTWDDENLTRFIRAICYLREIRTPVMHALIDDENAGVIW